MWSGMPATASRLELHHLLSLLTETVDPERYHVAGFEEFRFRLHAEADSRRSTGDDDVSRLHDEILRATPHDVPAIEDHGLGVAALTLLAVDVEPHGKVLRILDLVLGDQPRPERTEGLAAFPLGPLAGALDLEYAFGYVIGETIPGNRIQRLVLRKITRPLADHDAELDFPVELARPLRNHGVVVRSADAGRSLVEYDRLLGNWHPRFRGVIRIIQSDRNEIADPADAGAQSRIARNKRQLVDWLLADFGETLW